MCNCTCKSLICITSTIASNNNLYTCFNFNAPLLFISNTVPPSERCTSFRFLLFDNMTLHSIYMFFKIFKLFQNDHQLFKLNKTMTRSHLSDCNTKWHNATSPQMPNSHIFLLKTCLNKIDTVSHAWKLATIQYANYDNIWILCYQINF